MWILKKINAETAKYLISEKKSYTVGRKNCDIVFDEDSSISRKHCTLYIAKQNECPFQVKTSTGVWLVDEQSKYGTFVRNNKTWVQLNPGQNYKLSHGDIVKFGMMENIWSFEYKPLIVCTSGIQSSQKTKIEQTLKSVDGELRHSWCKGCSFVIVNEITLTVKVVLALILGVPIVTPNYVEKVVNSIKSQEDLPKPENYRPKIKETVLDASLVSLDVKNTRKDLFKGKTFLIPTTKQMENLKEVIAAAGGKAELLKCNGPWVGFAEENTIVIQTPFNDSTISDSLCKTVKEIATYLQDKHNKRIIPESEIAQAVAYSSIEKYCNPRSSCFSLKRVQLKESHGDLLVEETPDLTQEKIPDSCVIPNSATINSQQDDIFEPRCSQIAVDELRSLPKERKRAHSPVPPEDSQKKKPKKQDKPARDITIPDSESTVIEGKCKTVKKSEQVRVNSSKSSDISNYFIKLDKTTTEIPQDNSEDFWNCENFSLKRKSSVESNTDSESLRKKTKFSEKPSPKPAIDTPGEVVETVERKSLTPPIVRKVLDEEERGLSEYFGKDEDEVDVRVDELNNTIFSLTLISPAYLKADGSLMEPPSIPVNVKKFRKQTVQSIVMVNPVECGDDELSDGEWIEPHPREVGVGDNLWNPAEFILKKMEPQRPRGLLIINYSIQ